MFASESELPPTFNNVQSFPQFFSSFKLIIKHVQFPNIISCKHKLTITITEINCFSPSSINVDNFCERKKQLHNCEPLLFMFSYSLEGDDKISCWRSVISNKGTNLENLQYLFMLLKTTLIELSDLAFQMTISFGFF